MTDFVLVLAAAAALGGAPAAPPAAPAESLALPASNLLVAEAPAPKAPVAASGPQRRVFRSAEECERAAAALPATASKRAVCLPHESGLLAESAF